MTSCHSEEWRPIPGFEGHYEVSDQGRVRTLARVTTRRRKDGRSYAYRLRERILKTSVRKAYAYVNLRLDGAQRSCNVHRLVAEVFHGEPPTPDAHASHLNGDALDNRAANLRWDSPEVNRTEQALRMRTVTGDPMAVVEYERFMLRREGCYDALTLSDLALAPVPVLEDCPF